MPDWSVAGVSPRCRALPAGFSRSARVFEGEDERQGRQGSYAVDLAHQLRLRI